MSGIFDSEELESWNTSLDSESRRKMQCAVCPYAAERPAPNPTKKVDILIVSQKGVFPIYVHGFDSQHIFDIECADPGVKPLEGAEDCCLGRTLSAIMDMRPQVVISIGYTPVFKRLEHAFGQSPEGPTHLSFLPTQFENHKFWHVSLEEFDIHTQLDKIEDQLRRKVKEVPEVWDGNPDGLEYVVRNEDIGPAFDWLRSQDYVSLDLETTGLRPYANDAQILTAAIGTLERTYCFPLLHPQTPSYFDVQRVFDEMGELPAKTNIVAHNSPFELEWLCKLFGLDYGYKGRWQDTMAQNYLLFTGQPKDLNTCIRRNFGFNLKAISDIDIKNLKYAPLEKVLEYNGMDSKYTDALFKVQKEMIESEGLSKAYEMQLERIVPVVLMQIQGLKPNDTWALTEGKKAGELANEALRQFQSYPEVQLVMEKYGKCDPSSPKDLARLFYEELGVRRDVESFNETFLATLKHPVARTLDAYREHSKKYSTWVLPTAKCLPGGGAAVHDDGRVHPHHNSMRVVTGRFSCTSPNVYAYPSRGGNKKWRNAIGADDGCIMQAADLGQVEYRIVASITGDAAMIKFVRDDNDAHMFWAKRLVKALPGFFVKDENDKDQMKEFRGLVKNKWTFPLVYRSLWSSVIRDLGAQKYENDISKVIKEFFDFHEGLSAWQERMLKFERENGYIVTPLGRKYRGPLREQQTCNWIIQGTAFDFMCGAMCRLTKRAIEENKPWFISRNFVYDDLIYVLPFEHAAEASFEIVKEICRVDMYSDWLTVPIAVEVSAGPAWGSLKEVGTYSSDKIWANG